ncbi:hypothetical protein [Micromonospora sp. NPDC048898]|uniref:hypothetical protein n=1 Tax=Micromonospora sp. NPDC048898 TaxID=3364260 RepID=UPI003722ACC8
MFAPVCGRATVTQVSGASGRRDSKKTTRALMRVSFERQATTVDTCTSTLAAIAWQQPEA